MSSMRTIARKAAMDGLLAKLRPFSRRERYEMPFKITGGWGQFDCYCQDCAIAEVGELRAIGIDDGPEDFEGDWYADKANVCESCHKPLQFMLSLKGVNHELKEYQAAPPKEATPRAAYILCAIMENMRDHADSYDFEAVIFVEVVRLGRTLCELIDAQPQMELFPIETLCAPPDMPFSTI